MHAKNHKSEAAAKGGPLFRVLLILGVLLLLVALGVIGYIVWQYLDAQQRYTQIQQSASLELNLSEGVSADTTLEDLRFNWEELRAINPDVVGWVVVPETNINYPIVQGTDNEFYLNHLFDRAYSASGAVFVDADGSPTLDGQNNLIYGHNVFDGTMFSNMLQYSAQDYFDSHQTVYLCTPEANIELVALASINIAADAPLRQFSFASQTDFSAFVSRTLGQPLARASHYDELYSEAEALYSFITCETIDASRRVVLCCVPVRSVTPDA